MKKYLNRLFLIGVLSFVVLNVIAQDDNYNPIYTAAPSLSIAPDARGGGMGDIGAATLPDVYSQHWNPAKYAFMTSRAGLGVSYTPWLRKLVNDMALIYASGYFKLGEEDNQALSASLRYFTMGDVLKTDFNGYEQGTISPYEMAFDVGYSRKLSETFSGAVALRFIMTDYKTGSGEEVNGTAFAADIAGYNESYVVINNVECLLGLGFNISNIGTKISTADDSESNFIPTTLRLGGSLTYPLDDYNTLALNLDVSKLLVPTPPVKGEDESEDEFKLRRDDYKAISSISGVFKSFGDAPGGFSEELKEIMWSLGAEYTYDNRFSVRGGYYYENEMKGNRKYFSFGAGLKMNVFQIDASYLVSTSGTSPLDQTLRFSIGFEMEGLRNLLK
ncbi:hypothetical protein D0T53_10460 [Dysgonomonas sp. 216]|uniref:type IX secretion system outer membrane channel protein PorV n=1 Tax=Dysgonomonas sp. 216 TaxID=2302934 RepID=UPI0013D2F8F6|nr:type IX secretion system outer membrane channel protein PorV [Dysgonomonas sp. 216]NDW19331.1 hypothetical protein [Dysgonomonas sp. 216]